MLPTYEKLLKAEMKMLVFSGDPAASAGLRAPTPAPLQLTPVTDMVHLAPAWQCCAPGEVGMFCSPPHRTSQPSLPYGRSLHASLRGTTTTAMSHAPDGIISCRLRSATQRGCLRRPPGDIDGIVPLVGTRRWISGLGLRIKEPWRPYFSLTGKPFSLAGRPFSLAGELCAATTRPRGFPAPPPLLPLTRRTRCFYGISYTALLPGVNHTACSGR